MSSTKGRQALRWGMYGVVGAGIVYVGTTVQMADLWAAMRRVPAWTLVLGACCALVNLFGKGTIWWLFLPSSVRPPLVSLWALILRAAASSIIMPLRAGEGLRVWWLMRRCGLPMAHVVAIALAEKVVNLVALVIVVTLAASWEQISFPWITRAGSWLLATATLGVLAIGLALAARRHLGRLEASLRVVSAGGVVVWAQSLLCALTGWLGDCILVALMAHAAGAPLRPLCAPFVLLAINVAIALPGTPGHVGTMELASVTALSAFGSSRETALCFALLYHGVQIVAVLLLTAAHLLWRCVFGDRPTSSATAVPLSSTQPDK